MSQQVMIAPVWKVTADAGRLPLASESVDCIVTSPPYNVGIEYPSGADDEMNWLNYERLVSVWCYELYRVMKRSGRIWLNVQPAIPIPGIAARAKLGHIWLEALSNAGFVYRDTVTWIQDSFDGGCAWGSWLRPSAPNLRGSSEQILVMYKDKYKRTAPKGYESYMASREDLGGDWTDLCRNVWKINPSRKKGFPAAFPIELPARAIRLSTWPGELVLDPFAGSGTTGAAAELLGRRCVLTDLGW